MNIKQTIKLITLGLVASLGLLIITTPKSFAATECAGVKTSIVSCQTQPGSTGIESSGIWGLLLMVINILTAGVGVLAVGGIVYGAILYTSAGGSPEGVKKARGIITNVVIGVLAYALMFALLNFIIPGGLLKP